MLKNQRRWQIILTAIMAGVLFAFVDWKIDQYVLLKEGHSPNGYAIPQWLVPITVSIIIAFGTNLYLKQKKLNQVLSTENTKLKSKVLVNTVSAYILHEIRNPIHNINAILEKAAVQLTPADSEILERNLNRLSGTTAQLKRMSTRPEDIDLYEKIEFHKWIGRFVENCVADQLHKFSIAYQQNIAPLTLKIHPLLLEQCLTLLFDNAITAVQNDKTNRRIGLTALRKSDEPDCAVVKLWNTGAPLPPEVIKANGRTMVKSVHGSGLGLVLVRDTLTQIHGNLTLSNTDAGPEAALFIPAESL